MEEDVEVALRSGARGRGSLQAEEGVCMQALRHLWEREAGVPCAQSGSAGPSGQAVGHREAARREMAGPLRP